MLVPEARQAVEWMKQLSARLALDADTPLSPDELQLLVDAAGYLDGARSDCEGTLAGIDALRSEDSDSSNPINALAWSLKSNKSQPGLQAVKQILDNAIEVLEEHAE